MKWMRYAHQGQPGFGTLADGRVQPHRGTIFGEHQPEGEPLDAADVQWLPPCEPRQVVALWNNFHAAAQKNGWAVPAEPLYFLKSPHAAAGHGEAIAAVPAEVGRVAFEGELVIVIGRRTHRVDPGQALSHVFGWTCGNDLTAIELLDRDPSFRQWARAKSLPGFAAFGPVIETAFEPSAARVRTFVAGRERQDYPLADMIFDPSQIVSRLSQDLILDAGDLIYCGTSLGVLPIKPGTAVEISIDGIGTLVNRYG